MDLRLCKLYVNFDFMADFFGLFFCSVRGGHDKIRMNLRRQGIGTEIQKYSVIIRRRWS